MNFIFKTNIDSANNVHLGIVFGFRFLARFLEEKYDEKNKLTRRRVTKFKDNYVLTDQTDSRARKNYQEKNIEVLCVWYTWKESGILQLRENTDNSIVNMNDYLASMTPPKIVKETGNPLYFLSSEHLNELKKIIGLKP